MKLNLEAINAYEDSTKEIYASDDCQNLLKMWKEYYPKIGFNLPWVGYFIKHENKFVGSCAFTGKPIDNRVEISYWTFKEFEGKGIASFACKELVSIAYEADPGLTVTAKTAPEHNASTKILEKNNFVFSEIVQDEEIGNAWLWIHKKSDR